jgi:hypothetical protein
MMRVDLDGFNRDALDERGMTVLMRFYAFRYVVAEAYGDTITMARTHDLMCREQARVDALVHTRSLQDGREDAA